MLTFYVRILEKVLHRLEAAGLRVKQSKCKFLQPSDSVTYLGYQINADDIHHLVDKVKAIEDAPPPKNVLELRSYFGLLSYYSKLLPGRATVLAPIYRLLRKEVRWQWMKEELEAFQRSRELLLSSDLLVHFNPELEIVLACNACLLVWSWGSLGSQDARWFREASGLCLKNAIAGRA